VKRAEFIKLFCDAVDRGRCRRYPDMRPSERAFTRIDDTAVAFRLWRKMTPASRRVLRPQDVTGEQAIHEVKP
jgi:hypothetical protein